jgi:DNA-binding MarR family transcriptional regulator
VERFAYLSSGRAVKSTTSARTKRKPRRAVSGGTAATASAHVYQRAMAMQVLRKLRALFRLAKSQPDTLPKRTRPSSAELWTLCELRDHPGMRLTDLADAMALRQSTVSNLIKKLRHRRLIRRTRDNMDARVVHLYLTADGARAVIKTRSAPHNVLLDTLEHLSVKTLRLLDRELTGLLDGTRDGYIS